jgi:hypothetical protein
MSDEPREGIETTVEVTGQRKKLAPPAKFGILLAVLIFGGVLFQSRFTPQTKPQKRPPVQGQIAPGDKLNLPGEDWAANGETLVIVMAVGCDFCEAMAPFYKELTQKLVGRKDLRVVFVLPQAVDQSKDFLSGLGLDTTDVKQATIESISVKGTPTVIIVNRTGVVTDSWLGTMSAEQESALTVRLKADKSDKAAKADKTATAK